MTLEKFTKQVERLRGTFGERNYTDERAEVLYGELRGQFNDAQFEIAVSHFIATARHAPLLQDFVEALNKLETERRERERMSEPTPVTVGLDNVPAKGVNMEFVRACRSSLADYQSGKINRAQFDQACDVLDHAARELKKLVSAAPCPTCGGGSVVLARDRTGVSRLYRCHCRLGELAPSELVWRDRNGVEDRRPFYRLYSNSTAQTVGRERATGERDDD